MIYLTGTNIRKLTPKTKKAPQSVELLLGIAEVVILQPIFV